MCHNSSIFTCIFVVLGLLVASVLAVLFYFGYVPFLFNLVIIAAATLIFAIILLVVLSLIALLSKNDILKECLCRFGRGILITAVLVLFFILLSVIISLSVGSIVSAVILFFLLLFWILLVYYTVSLINCIINHMCPLYPPCPPIR